MSMPLAGRAGRLGRIGASAAALAAAAALTPWPCHAQTADAPSLIGFQGRLTDTLSNPLGGSHDFIFAVFPAASGGTALWTETQTSVSVVNGVLSVQLGAVVPVPADVFRLDTAYLQITVDGAPLSPRQRLVSAPYALNSRLLRGRDYDALVSTDAAQTVGGQKSFLAQITVASDVYISAGQLNVKGNRLTTGAGLLDAGKLSGALPALDGSALTGLTAGAVAAGGVDLSTVTAALAGKLSSSAGVPAGLVDLSTVTAALAGKLSATTNIAPGQIDLSTVTAALAGKLDVGGNAANITGNLAVGQIDLSTVAAALAGKLSSSAGVPAGLVDLSTVTTALAGKLSSTTNIAPGQIDLSTVTAALAGKLSSSAGVPAGLVDLSTVTAALAGKLSSSAGVPAGLVDLSTVTTALAGKLSSTANIAPGQIDLSTVTAALAGKLSSSAGVPAGLVDLSTVTTALAAKLADGAGIATGLIDLSTVTAGLAGKLSLAGGFLTGQLTTDSTVTVKGGAFSVAGDTLTVVGGRVGIGTSAPQRTLHVNGVLQVDGPGNNPPYNVELRGAVPGIGFQTSSGNGAAVLEFRNSGGGQVGSFMYDFSGNTMLFSQGGTTRMALTSAGRLGVGTFSPATLLDTAGSAQFGSGVLKSTFAAVPGDLEYALSLSSGLDVARGPLRLNSGGFIRFADGSTQATAGGGAHAASHLSGGGDALTGTLAVSSLTASPSASGQNYGALVVSTHLYQTAGDLYTAGRVGIGTAEPATLLHAKGPGNNTILALIESTENNAYLKFKNSSSGAGVLSAGGLVGLDAGVDLLLWNAENGKLRLATNGTERITVLGGGNVGVGTGSPLSKLSVLDGDIRISTGAGQPSRGIIFQDGSVQTTAASGGAEANTYGSSKTFSAAVNIGGATLEGGALSIRSTSTVGSHPALSVWDSAGQGGLLRVQEDGRVGIGNDLPGNMLDVAGSVGADKIGLGLGTSVVPSHALEVGSAGAQSFTMSNAGDAAVTTRFTNSVGNAEFGVLDSAGAPLAGGGASGAAYLGTPGAAPLQLVTDNQPRLTVAGGGNVGVGTSLPAAKLDVAGDAQFGSGSTKSTVTSAGRFLAVNGTQGAPAYSFGAESNTGMYVQPGNPNIEFSAGGQRRFLINTNGQINMPSGSAGVPGLSDITNQNAGLFMGNRFVAVTTDGVERLRATADGKVGVGTGVPAARLHVSSAGATASQALLVVSSGTGTGQELLTVMGDGKTGLGTASPAYGLDVSSHIRATGQYYATTGGGMQYVLGANGNSSNGYGLGWNGVNNLNIFAGAGSAVGVTSTEVSIPGGNCGGAVLCTRSSASEDGLRVRNSDNVYRFVVTNQGRVGVGTESPLSALHILDGDIRISTGVGQASRGIIFQDGSVQTTAASGGAGETNTFASSKTIQGALGATNSIRSSGWTATPGGSGVGLEVMYITPNGAGSLLSYDRDASLYKLLDYYGSDHRFYTGQDSNISAILAGDRTLGLGTYPGAAAARLHVSSASASAADTLLLVSSGTGVGQDLLAVKGDGSVGIGVAAPSTRLHVRGPGNNTYLALVESTENNAYLKFKNASSGAGVLSAGALVGLDAGVDLLLWNAENGKLRLATNGTERITVLGGGNVGVGTGAPLSKLSVLDGDIRISTGVGQASRGIIFQDGSVQTTAAGAGDSVARTGDTMTGSLVISASTLTVGGPIVSTGTAGGLVVGGAGTRFEWIPASSSLRAGYVSGAQWDGVNIGPFSTAFGDTTLASGDHATVGGGQSNSASGTSATVGGGNQNTASGAAGATVAGGWGNTAAGNTSAIGGGSANAAPSGASYGTIAGGYSNTASGQYSTVPGGYINLAQGSYSLAAGNRAKASAQGSFVWADSQGVELLNTTTDQFLLRARGGFYAQASSASFTHPSAGTLFTVDGSSAHFRVPVTVSAEVLVQSTLTVQGPSFSVGGSTLVVTGGLLGLGTAAPGQNLIGSGVGYGLSNTLLHVKSAPGGGGYASLALEGSSGSTLDLFDSGAAANKKFMRLRMDDGTAKFQSFQDDVNTAQADNILALDLTNGRTGFGTAAPTDRVSVVGQLGLDDDLVTSDRGCFRFNGTADQLEYSNDCTTFQSFSASAGGGWVDDGTAVRLNTSTDWVGMGTASPQAPLHISKPAGVVDPPNLILGHVDTTDHYSGIRFRDETSGNHKWGVGVFNDSYSVPALQNSFFIYQYKNKSEGAVEAYRLSLNDSGDMGLGTSSPVGGVHVMNRGLSLAGSCHPDFNGANVAVGLDYCPGSGDFRIYSHGNAGVVPAGKGFGVGTWTPDSMLHVSSANATASETLLKVSSGTGTGQELFVVKGDGKVGIGTAGPAVKLHVAGTAAFGSPVNTSEAADRTLILGARPGSSTLASLGFDVGGARRGDFDYNGTDGSLRYWNYESAAWTERFVVDSSGRLGVGTSSPLSRLHVLDGDIRVSTSAGQASRGIVFQDGSVQVTAAGASLLTANGSDAYLTNLSGKLGVGTNSPARPLHVEQNDSIIAQFIRPDGANTQMNLESGSGGSVKGVQLGVYDVGGGNFRGWAGSSSAHPFELRSNSATRLFLDTAGQVGVGTVAPAAKLHVSSASAAAADTLLTVSSGTGTGQELLVVKGDGRVGVGTASPTSTFTVRGAARVSGSMVGPLAAPDGVTLAGDLTGSGEHTTGGSGAVIIARSDSNGLGDPVDGLIYAAGSNTNSDALGNNSAHSNSVMLFGHAVNLRDSGDDKGVVQIAGKSDQHCIVPGGAAGVTGDCATLYLNHGGGAGKSQLVGDVDSVYNQDGASGGGYFTGIGRAGTLEGNSANDNPNAAGSALLVGRVTGAASTSSGEFLVVSSHTSGVITAIGSNSLSIMGNGARARLGPTYVYGGAQRGANSVFLEFRDFKPLEQMAAGGGLTVTDGDIRLSTTTGSKGIVFQDGTVQTTAGTGESNTYASSKTVTGSLGVGAAGLENGTLVVKSTTATGANPVLRVLNNSSSELFRFQTDGRLGIWGSDSAEIAKSFTSAFSEISGSWMARIHGGSSGGLFVSGDDLAMSSNKGTLSVFSETASLPNGGSIALGGKDDSGNFRTHAVIKSGKESPDWGNSNPYGFLSFGTRPDGGNVTERLRITSAGKVGIGTTTPSAMLEVRGEGRLGTDQQDYVSVQGGGGTARVEAGGGNTNVNLSLASKGTGSLYFWSAGYGTTSRLYIDGSNGYAGFGTVSPLERLDVLGSVLFRGNLNNTGMVIGSQGGEYAGIGYNVKYTGTNNSYKYRSADSVAYLRMGGEPAFEFKAAASGTADSAITFTDVMSILQDGSVGVGAASPSDKLHVKGGNVRIENSSGNYCILRVDNDTSCDSGSSIGTNANRALCLVCN